MTGRRDAPVRSRTKAVPAISGTTLDRLRVGTRLRVGARLRPALIGEVVVVVVLIRVYDWIRRLAATRSASAEHHALDIERLERLLHLDAEHPANRWLAGHSHLEFLASGWYQFAHIPVTIGLLGWCYWRRPELYRPARNALVAINVVGLAVFLTFPVMPPRLLPGGGFVDSLAATGLGTAPAGPVSPDEFAAMPSLHLAWATWVAVLAGIVLAGRVRRPALAVAAYPLITAVVTVATANHFTLDVVAGVAVALAAAGATGLLRLGRTRPGRPEAVGPGDGPDGGGPRGGGPRGSGPRGSGAGRGVGPGAGAALP